MVVLSIIILTYNTKNLTIACIESIIRQYKEALEIGEFEVIVVDNGSSDGTVESIKKQVLSIMNLRIIENKENYGFSKGNNIGARKARGMYLFFLNSDTMVGDEGLVAMVTFLEKNKHVGILGARLRNSDGTNQASAGKFYNLINVLFMLLGSERLGLLRFSPKIVQSVDWVSGAAMMVRKSLFDKLVGFDERFFMYIEDMELCFRAEKLGYLTYFYPHVTIVHREFGSSNRTFAIVNIYQGLLYFYKKHMSSTEYTIAKLLLMAKACVAIVIGICTNNSYLTSTYRKALSLSI